MEEQQNAKLDPMRHVSIAHATDERLLLVKRILQTAAFVRSPRLAEFLSHICKTALEGRNEELNEHGIGVAVFRRPVNYDSSADTVVRSNALRLRRRLEQYFAREGRGEPLRLEIPRGAYIPVFRMATATVPSSPSLNDKNELKAEAGIDQAKHAFPTSVLDISLRVAADDSPGKAAASEQESPLRFENEPHEHSTRTYGRALAAALLGCLVLTGLLIAALLGNRAHYAAPAASQNLLWSLLFTSDQPTRIVLGDSGLVLFHAITHRKVSLDEYLHKDYSREIPYAEHTDAAFAQFTTTRRYTSVIDAVTLTRLLHLPEAKPDRTLVQYARDMRLNDFKSGNLILLGAQEADPWVELFERSMDFVDTADTPGHISTFLNRAPKAGEKKQYSALPPEPSTRTYAVIAFEPNLGAMGDVLLLEGLNMAGTEAAVDLVLNDARISPLLNSIRKPGGSLPYFEILLESTTVTENASPAQVVTIHVHTDTR